MALNNEVRAKVTLFIEGEVSPEVHLSAAGPDQVAVWFGDILITGAFNDVRRTIDSVDLQLERLADDREVA